LIGNLFGDLPESLPEELHERLAEGRRFRLDRIVSTGHASEPGFWYRQDEAEWVLVLSGRARLMLRDPDQQVDLGPGSWIELAPGRPHRVDSTSGDEPTVWLALYFDP